MIGAKLDSVLVTGSSGFLGQAILGKLMAAGNIVTGIDPAPPPGNAAYRHVTDDLADPAWLAQLLLDIRPDAVIHAGGISGPMVPVEPIRLMAINVAGSVNLLHASETADVKRFVFCSSISAVGEFSAGPLPDEAPLQPTTVYGASKAAMDQVLRGLHGRLAMQLCALRLTGVYGPGRRTANLFGDLVAGARGQHPVHVTAVTTSAPYVYVDDAADAAIAAAQSPDLPQLFYNIAHPELVSAQDIAAALDAARWPVRLILDPGLPVVRRGTLAVAAALRDFGFAAAVDHRDGIRRMLAARG